MGELNWESVDEVFGELQAELLRGLLEAQDIPVMLNQEGAGRAYGINVGRLGQIQILVPSDYAVQARAILNDYYAGAYEDQEFEQDEGENDAG
jgi:hypothetical protein